MKTSLQLKLGQQLAMTPQLQQAIRLLQLSTLDLQQEIQEALDANPLLELEESAHETLTGDDGNHHNEHDTATAEQETARNSDDLDSADALGQNEMPDDLPVDTTWDDVYSANSGSTGLAFDDGVAAEG